MSFLDFYEKVQDRFSYEGAKELYKFLNEVKDSVNFDFIEASKNFQEFKSWRDATLSLGKRRSQILDEHLVIPCVNGFILEIK